MTKQIYNQSNRSTIKGEPLHLLPMLLNLRDKDKISGFLARSLGIVRDKDVSQQTSSPHATEVPIA